ncbi:Aminomethyltransferase [Carpediemonas membranifera]|uniref:Aminomethyltransferase n=1 Tax=Carpediemonas membranifera TaxID=201153 RepID=A0A8J6AVL1_9EUKA|nr:Aminomethyltransferase [Carpediemonas membranifera]|eukprot:KAG9393620.1 Aminomethyltransferase [Carpediemonas membranifera]
MDRPRDSQKTTRDKTETHFVKWREYNMADISMKKTPLFNLHTRLGGEMVPFAGFAMPVKYDGVGIIESHLHCRNNASLFDVSHMGQVKLGGKDREKFLEKITVCDVTHMAPHQTKLSVMTTPEGTIIDDMMITRHDDHCFLVLNAACFAKDSAHIKNMIKQLGMDVTFDDISPDRALMAIQGPKAARSLQNIVKANLAQQPFMSQRSDEFKGEEILVSRCGYTGEDGFEVSVPNALAEDFAQSLLDQDGVAPCGLGARDSLRLEAGLCLYGNDIDTTTTPIEANLTWLITKRRRAEGGFIGDNVIIPQINDPKLVTRRRVGLCIKGAPAREHTPVFTTSGAPAGEITSGLFSPCLKKPISMGYIDVPHHKADTELLVEVRGRKQPAKVVKMPFVPTNYYRGATN